MLYHCILQIAMDGDGRPQTPPPPVSDTSESEFGTELDDSNESAHVPRMSVSESARISVGPSDLLRPIPESPLGRDSAEFRALMDRVAVERGNRVTMTHAEWEARVRTIEQIANRRLRDEPMGMDPLDEARRLMRLVTWMLTQLRALCGD